MHIGKFTHDNDKILYVKIDSIISPLFITISDQVLIASSVAGVEYQINDRSKILFYVGDPDNDNAQIVIHDLSLDRHIGLQLWVPSYL